MGSAAAHEKLDEEFLVGRGIRVTSASLMKSAFNDEGRLSPINIRFANISEQILSLQFDRIENENGWKINLAEVPEHLIEEIDNAVLPERNFDQITKELENEGIVKDGRVVEGINSLNLRTRIGKLVQELFGEEIKNSAKNSLYDFLTTFDLKDFLVFAPENTYLRRFEEEGQSRPLKYRGEGLFSHLVKLSKENPETFKAIADNLSLIDWYGGFSIPNDLQFTERRIAITDRFIADTIKDFDQRSANEGFLYLLFYFTLFLSKWTPKFFAIDNVDNALNPRLCAKLVEVLAKLAKEQDKQAILTTHNPAVLDGLDLEDEEQRLFVIYRNADGATKARRIKPLKAVEGAAPVRLSEAFVRGYLGGLPKNF